MAADILAAWDEIEGMSAMISLDHRIYFDPRKFASDNPAPIKNDFILGENEIREWGCRCSRIRLRIMEESRQLLVEAQISEPPMVIEHRKEKRILSRPSSNLDGLSERQL